MSTKFNLCLRCASHISKSSAVQGSCVSSYVLIYSGSTKCFINNPYIIMKRSYLLFLFSKISPESTSFIIFEYTQM